MKYEQMTSEIKVKVKPNYEEKMSSVESNNHIWSYNILIENVSNRSIKILKRKWIAIDSFGFSQEIQGIGVVGEQPVIEPGDLFEYSSHIQLDSSSGVMLGVYEVLDLLNNDVFSVTIPTFSLDCPHEKFTLN